MCAHVCTLAEEVRTNNHFIFVLIRGHLVTICSSWLRQEGKFVLYSRSRDSSGAPRRLNPGTEEQ